ncbi:MAG: hypothetical protein SF052_09260 [Bacteroidia bacterium]|nr:hypothetical protein [Bacteroidia bacterium]
MKTNTYFFVAAFTLLLSYVSPLSAQGTFTMSGSYIRPLGELASQNFRQGGGISMDMISDDLRKNALGSLQMGFHLDAGFHGSEKRPVDSYYPIEGPVDIQISNESFGMYGLARVITSERFPLRLYADGLAGTRMLASTQYILPQDEHQESEECEGENLTRSWTFLYGASAGMLIRINHEVSVDLRTTLTRGSHARYVDLESLNVGEHGMWEYNTRRAATDMMQVSLGLNMVLGACTPSRNSISDCSSSCGFSSGGGCVR